MCTVLWSRCSERPGGTLATWQGPCDESHAHRRRWAVAARRSGAAGVPGKVRDHLDGGRLTVDGGDIGTRHTVGEQIDRQRPAAFGEVDAVRPLRVVVAQPVPGRDAYVV